jgi:hypothetical protein
MAQFFSTILDGRLLCAGLCLALLHCSQKDPDATDEADDVVNEDDASEDDTSGDETVDTRDAGNDTEAPTDGGHSVADSGTPVTDPPDSSDPNVIGDDEMREYFPLIDGATWTYRHTKVGEEVWNEVVTVQVTGDDDAPEFRLVDEPNRDGEVTEQLWRWVDSSVMRVERRELLLGELTALTTYDPGFTRFDTSWTRVGVSQTVTYVRNEQHLGETPTSETRTQRFEVLDIHAEVTIDDRTYDDCLLVSRTRPDTGDVGHYWFAKGFGKVKELDPDSMTTEELIDYSIP